MTAADHPSDADLRSFAVGALTDPDADRVAAHLADCPACQALAATAPDDSLVTLLRTAETSQAGPGTPGPSFALTVTAGLSQANTESRPAAAPPELARHARYRLIRPLGRGGMGQVWLAEHTVMGRTVALKIVRPEFLDRPAAVERFRREVRAAARLSHPNIVAAHDAEEAGGIHFLAMEFIDGDTLAERAAAGPVPVADACRWAIDAARGLDHARQAGLIHRDVKPHNLILDRTTGRVKVLDFGLAGVAAGEASGLTGGNVVIGTPNYIAPEQAEDPRTADTRSDVYSLGCTLYHLLAGRPPFQEDTVLRTIDAHRTRPPGPLSAARQDMLPALSDLVARMMAKEPKDRPQTPGEVAAALEAILAGAGTEPPAPPTRPTRARGRRWWPVLPAVAALAAFVLVAGLVDRLLLNRGHLVIEPDGDDVEVVVKQDGETVRHIHTRTDRNVALRPGSYELELSGAEGYLLDVQQLDLGRGQTVRARVLRALPVVAGPPRVTELVGGPDAPWTELLPLLDGEDLKSGGLGRTGPAEQPVLALFADPKQFARVVLPVRPDGAYEVRARFARSVGEDCFALMLPLPGTGGSQLALIVDGYPKGGGGVGVEMIHEGNVSESMEKAFGGRLQKDRVYELVAGVAVRDGKVTVTSSLDGKPLFRWTGAADTVTPTWTFFTPDRRHLGFGTYGSAYRVEGLAVRMLSGKGELTRVPAPAPVGDTPVRPGPVGRFGQYRGGLHDLVMSPDGSAVYLGDDGVSRWDVASRTMTWEQAGANGAALALSGDGKVLTAWADGKARAIDPGSGKVLRESELPEGGRVIGAVLSGDGRRAVFSTEKVEDGPAPAIRGWDLGAGKELYQLKGHTDNTYGLALSPDGSLLATASYDGTVRLWDAATGKERHLFKGHEGQVSCVAFSADGKYLVSGGGNDQGVRVWSVEEERCVSVLAGHTVWVTGVAFTPDGTRVVSVSGYEAKGDGVRVWDWRAGEQLHHFAEVRGGIGKLAVTPDGRAVTGEFEGTVRVWRLPGPPAPKPETVGPVRRFGRFAGQVNAVAFGPDGKHVYALDTAVVKWDLAAVKVVWAHELRSDGSLHVAAAPDGRHVLAGCIDGTVRVLDAKTGEEAGRFCGHQERILALAVSPDGKRCVSSSGVKEDDGPRHSIRVWEVDTLKELFRLKGHQDETWGVAWSADGGRIATASDDGSVRLWDAADGSLLDLFTGHKGLVSSVAISPDGKRVASGGQDLGVRVWESGKKEPVHVMEGHDLWVTGVEFTPDGTRVVSVGSNWDQEASEGLRVWDARTGKALYEGGVKGKILPAKLAVGPAGRYAVTGGMEGAVHVWKLPDPPK